MSSDVISPLDGEPTVPGVAPPKAPSSNFKQLVAVAILLLSVVAILGFAISRYFGRSAPEPETPAAAPDVASARAPALKMPAAEPVVPPPAPTPQMATTVPSLAPEAGEAAPIEVRGNGGKSTGGGGGQKTLHPDDAPIFAAGAAPTGATAPQARAGTATTQRAAGTGDRVADARASLDAYQRQLSGMLENLQTMTAGSGTRARPTPAPVTGSLAAAGQQGSQPPALFGSMAGSATPTVQAQLPGDRSMRVPKGTLFVCSLKTRVVSATSGFIGCQVTRNVFSDNGRVLLIERGSHMDGEYRVVTVRPGVTRIPVLWTRLRTTEGVTVDLDSPATGQLGESGLGGHVDNRWGERLGAAMLVSLIDDAIKYAIASETTSGDNTVLLPNTADQGSKLAEKVLETTINIPPLMYQNQGGVVGVYVARDLDFSSVYELKPQQTP